MARTLLVDIYKKAVSEYTRTPEEWAGLLSCAARYYKRSFDNAVLVYAQRPDATQLATFDEWHDKRIGRSVNRGAKGIAVIDMINPRVSLKYLYDLMDTNGSEQSFKNVIKYCWELEEQYQPRLTEILYERYSTSFESIESCLGDLVRKKAAQVLPRYMEQFRISDESSFLYGMPIDAVKEEFMEIVTDSAIYTVFCKCGIRIDVKEQGMLENISHFNSLELFMTLGSCTVSLARSILKEINQEIKNIKKERSKAYENRAVDEFHVQAEQRRDADPQPADIRGHRDGQDTIGQLRQTVEGIHDGEAAPPLVRIDSTGQVKSDDNRSGRGSRKSEGNDDTGFTEGTAHTRYRGYAGEGSPHGNDNPDSGGNHTQRSGIPGEVNRDNIIADTPVNEVSFSGVFLRPDVEADKEPEPMEKEAAADPDNEYNDREEISESTDIMEYGDQLDDFAIPDEVYELQREKARKADALPEWEAFVEESDAETTPDMEKQPIETDPLQLEPYILIKREEYPKQQLDLFTDSGILPDTYEVMDGGDNDNIIGENVIADAAIVEEIQPVMSESPQISTPDKPLLVPDSGLNYRYSPDHNLYEGGPKTKCKNNIESIRLLKTLQAEGRNATAEEQVTLAKFVGWGGLANALTPGKNGWEREFEEIKNLLTEEEFKSAQESTTTAYFTEHNVIQHIYTALGRFGFREGNIIDPAMGTGNFYSVIPESMAGSRLYGVELDTITGGIAKQLYPDADIEVKGYEETTYPDHFFDIAIGNIPFNAIKVGDSRYDKYNFRIHDYFIAKTLDKVRSGGIIAFITSKYTLDKANPAIRKYMAQRAELIGAIRLPNNAFKSVAGTEATTDILFLQKRDMEVVPDERDNPWIAVGENEDGIPVNSYFTDHPEMVLGKMIFDESMFGNEKTTACLPREGDNLDTLLGNAVYYMNGHYREPTVNFDNDKETMVQDSIPADPKVKNYCYARVDDILYYRENSRMYKQDITGKKRERIEGLLEIRLALRTLIEFQTNSHQGDNGWSTVEYEKQLQCLIANLGSKYDVFVNKYGYINSSANVNAFSKDSDAPLLRSIEEEDKEHEEKGVNCPAVYKKTAVFYKATIKPKVMPKSVDNASEALKMSLNMKGRVDLNYMHWLYRKPDHTKPAMEEIIDELGDRIYQDPANYTGEPYADWITAEEYLSGNVKSKLGEAMVKADRYPELFMRNVEALRKVQPVPLTPQEISFSLGSTWIPVEIYQQFMYEKFQTSRYRQNVPYGIAIEYSPYNSTYHIRAKGSEKHSIAVNSTYGTERKNAYEILEESLNLIPVTVKDRVDYVDPISGEDKVKYVLNKVETVLAREKQAQIKLDFENWLFSNTRRGAMLTQIYNDRFNNTVPRQYNGNDLILPDKSGIKLRKHQLDVIAHGIYGNGNLLAAHEVGAGKTMSGVVIAYELKRIGAFHKPLITAPNHLIGQWEKEFLRLYPNANILVAGKKDLEKKNRRRFISRIATGDYDSIIMPHSSFELINLSREKQLAVLAKEIEDVSNAISMEKGMNGKSWSLKQMQIFQKNLQFRYDKLFNTEKKDDTINFEELGVDMLIVDEADVYKNNFSYSKLRNVAGIGSQNSQRAMDMHMKCSYINEMNEGKGIVYLTGTPISNSISELYVMQKTLQPKELEARGLLLFDSWVSTFGKIEASLEIRPEGNGYQMKNRFKEFFNIPELMSIFSLVADIKTSDMLPDLPVPKLATGKTQVVKTAITPDQKAIVDEIVMRAEDIRFGRVSSHEDNFLKLTNEARLLAVDPRILNPALPDDPNTKLNECARNTAEIYHRTADKKLTQLIFCDKGTPKEDGSFDFYHAIKEVLTAQGVKSSEIAFIHEATTDEKREKLFEKVRCGDIRILLGSTEKMGTGMNVQAKLFAVHHLDIPWRPRDLIQRNGRVLRQGNENEEVHIFQYITEQTFDAYLFQILEQKQRYISQIMTGRSSIRSCEDVDETVLQYAEFKALAVSDERIKEKMEVDNEISRLQILKSSWKTQKNELQNRISGFYPGEIKRVKMKIEKVSDDILILKKNKPIEFSMIIDGRTHTERVHAGEHLKVIARRLGKKSGDTLVVGSYAGFTVSLVREFGGSVSVYLNGKGYYSTDMGNSELGNITRLENLADRIEAEKAAYERELESLINQFEQAEAEVTKPFSDEEQLSKLLKRKVELDLALEFHADSLEGELTEEADGDSIGTVEPTKAASTTEERNHKKMNDQGFDAAKAKYCNQYEDYGMER